MNYVEALQKRYSVKKFDKSKTISPDLLKDILEAGRLSASSLGLQPYRILIAESEDIKEKLIPAFYNPSQISTCSHMIVVVSRKNIDESYIGKYFNHISDTRETPLDELHGFRKSIVSWLNITNESELLHWTEKQGYLALANMMFAAALEKVDSCPIEGFRPEIISEVLEIDQEKEKVSVALAIGYRAEDDAFQKMKKVRKPEELLFKFL